MVRRRCPVHTAWRWIPIGSLMGRMRFLAAFWSFCSAVVRAHAKEVYPDPVGALLGMTM